MKHIRPKNSAVTSSPKKPHAGAGEIRIIGGRYKRSKLTVPVAQHKQLQLLLLFCTFHQIAISC